MLEPSCKNWTTHIQPATQDLPSPLQVPEPELQEYACEAEPEPQADVVPKPAPESIGECISQFQVYHIGDFVAAKYDDNTYIGKVINMEDGDIQITFMEAIRRQAGHFRWPPTEDILWVYPQDFVGKIAPPVAKGRSARSFILQETDRIFASED